MRDVLVAVFLVLVAVTILAPAARLEAAPPTLEGCRSFTQSLDKKGLLTSGRSASFWYDCRSIVAGAWRQQCLAYCEEANPDGPERWSCKGACEAMREMLEKN
jgi:hypothetical protein